MSVHLKSQGVIELSGRCGADDAEVLQHHLLAMSGATVEWSDCEHLHSAVLQVLLVGAPLMRGAPTQGSRLGAPALAHQRSSPSARWMRNSVS